MKWGGPFNELVLTSCYHYGFYWRLKAYFACSNPMKSRVGVATRQD